MKSANFTTFTECSDCGAEILNSVGLCTKCQRERENCGRIASENNDGRRENE